MADPYPAYRAACERAPVQWSERLGAYLVLSYDHAAAVLRGAEWTVGPPDSIRQLASLGGSGPFSAACRRSPQVTGPAAEGLLWAAVNRFFTDRVRRRIRACVGAVVDGVTQALGEGEPIELMSELAYPISPAVVAELFDLDAEGEQLLASEAPKLARILELNPTPQELEDAGAAAMTVMLFLIPVLARRRRDPGDDLLSALSHCASDGVRLETKEIFALCLLMLATGHSLTANLIANGTLALLEHPDELDWLEQHPDLARQAVDELLRYDSPTQVVTRIARCTLSLDDTTVRKGARALVVLGAANRDPAHYSSPDRLDLSRTRPPHLAFANAPPGCPALALARLQAEETFVLLSQSPLGRSIHGWSDLRADSPTTRRLQTLLIAGRRRRPARSPRQIVRR
jgi:cytochrome P450